MTRPVLVRAFAETRDLQIRSDQRLIIGCAVPFDTPTEISELGETYTEQFARGAFARTISERGPERVKVLAQHDRQLLPVGRAQLLREDPDGLYCELRISQTVRGDEILTLVNDGALDALSIGFVPIKADTRTRGTVIRTEVALREVSVVGFPAYADALISGTRSQGTPVRDTARTRTESLRSQLKEFLP